MDFIVNLFTIIMLNLVQDIVIPLVVLQRQDHYIQQLQLQNIDCVYPFTNLGHV